MALIVYILINDAMLGLVKIGLTSTSLVDDTTIEFEGKHTSLSDAALIAIRRLGYEWKAIQGAMYWVYEGETLLERRDRIEQDRSKQ